MNTEFNHAVYKSAKDEADADAAGWVIPEDGTTKFKLTLFKFPPIADDEIRINIKYAGLCYSDVYLVEGIVGVPLKTPKPFCPGHEVFGVVSHVGEKSKNYVKIGDRVGYGPKRSLCNHCKSCITGNDNVCEKILPWDKYLAFKYWGGYSTAMQQPYHLAYKIPDEIPDEHVAPLLCAGQTVYSPFADYFKPGMKVAVCGIGGLGHLAIQFAAKMGAVSVAAVTGGIDDKREMIMKLGATEIINFKDEAELLKAGSRFDLVLNTTAGCDGKLFPLLVNLTAPLGTFAQIGFPDGHGEMSLNLQALIFKKVQVVGVAAANRNQTNDMLKFCANNKVYPISEFFEFEDTQKAYDRMSKGKPIFRVQVNVEKWAKKNNFIK